MGGSGSGTGSPRSPSGGGIEKPGTRPDPLAGKPPQADKLPKPKAPRPPIPNYGNGRKPVSADHWNTIHDVLDKNPKTSDTKKHVYRNVWAAEGGLKKDPSGSAVAGILDKTLADAKKNPKFADRLKDIETPSDLKDHPELVPDIYDAYFDENLKEIGGSAGLDKVGNKYAAAAMGDTVFRHGRYGGAKILRNAVDDVLESQGKEPLKIDLSNGEELVVGEKILGGYSQLAKNPATLGPLLDAVAEGRKKDKTEKGDLLRADYFRFEEERM